MNKKTELSIMGIDPGLAATGWGLIKKIGKQEVKLIDFGVIKTTKESTQAERLLQLGNDLKKLIKTLRPDIIAVEQLFFFKNVKSAMQVAEARGVILQTTSNFKTLLVEFTPLEIKQSLTGYGRADKQQIQRMVKVLLELRSFPKPDDAADALAVALTCAQSNKLK